MNRYIKKLAWWVYPLGLILALLIGQQWGFNKAQIDWDNPPAWVILPTISQMQAIFGAEVDGVWGKETQTKYDEYMGNINGIKYYTVSGIPNN